MARKRILNGVATKSDTIMAEAENYVLFVKRYTNRENNVNKLNRKKSGEQAKSK